MPSPVCFRLALVALLAALSGCVVSSTALPPALTAAQAHRLRELPLPYTVGVRRYEDPVYSEALAHALSEAHIFRRVAPLETLPGRPDLVATVEEAVHGTATIPVFSLLSLGAVPTSVREDHGYVFSLAPGATRQRKVRVDAHYNGMSTLGSAAAPLGVLPGYTHGDPEKTTRFREMLAYRTLVALRPSGEREGHGAKRAGFGRPRLRSDRAPHGRPVITPEDTSICQGKLTPHTAPCRAVP